MSPANRVEQEGALKGAEYGWNMMHGKLAKARSCWSSPAVTKWMPMLVPLAAAALALETLAALAVVYAQYALKLTVQNRCPGPW